MALHAIEAGMSSPVYIFKNSTRVYKLLEEIVDENTVLFIKGDMYSKEVSKLADDLKIKKSSTSD